MGCTDEYQLEVCIENVSFINVPTGFSPNGDDMNDRFFIHPYNVDEVEIRIYDRYGSLVYHSTDIVEGWDGTSSGIEQEIGVYMVVVDYFDNTAQDNKIYKGNLTLLR